MTDQPRITSYLDGFSRYMETAKDWQPITRRRYRDEVAVFARLFGDPPLSDVTPKTLLDWNAGFYEANYAKSTVDQKRAALKAFFSYLTQFEESQHAGVLLNVLNNHLHYTARAGPVRPAYPLEEDRLKRILEAAGRRYSTGSRNRALLHFMYSTGVRNSELTGLRLGGLDLDERLATVIGKGNKERLVVFDEPCKEDLERWLVDRNNFRWHSRTDYVFCSIDGKRLGNSAVVGILKDANKLAGFRKPVWPHVFRHTRVTDLLNNGMPLQDVAVMAGHTNVVTTMRYYHQKPSQLKESYDKATSQPQSLSIETVEE